MKTIAEQIELGLNASRYGCIHPFTGNPYIDKTLTSWTVYTDEYTDNQLPTEQGPLYKLHETCTRMELETYLKDVKWDKFFDFIGRNRKLSNETLSMPSVQTWLEDWSKRSKWELVYLILEVENLSGNDDEKYPYGFWDLIQRQSWIADWKRVEEVTNVPPFDRKQEPELACAIQNKITLNCSDKNLTDDVILQEARKLDIDEERDLLEGRIPEN